MNEFLVRDVSEVLGFVITDEGDLVFDDGKHKRPASVTEMVMWRLLITPQAEWCV